MIVYNLLSEFSIGKQFSEVSAGLLDGRICSWGGSESSRLVVKLNLVDLVDFALVVFDIAL